ncbi:hypothetical protein ACHAWF_010058 [Thalassiosira exigua]
MVSVDLPLLPPPPTDLPPSPPPTPEPEEEEAEEAVEAMVVEERRDDSETLPLGGSSSSDDGEGDEERRVGVAHKAGASTAAAADEATSDDGADGPDEPDDDDEPHDDPNVTVLDDAGSELDLHSVLSGNDAERDEDRRGDDDDDDDADSISTAKNLGAIFDDAEEMDRRLRGGGPTGGGGGGEVRPPPPPAAGGGGGGGPSVRRPPLPPGRSAASSSSAAAPKDSEARPSSSAAKEGAIPASPADGRKLAVYLRVRPPASSSSASKPSVASAAAAKDKGDGTAGSVNTVEVLEASAVDADGDRGGEGGGGGRGGGNALLPTTIRTYPPPTSNAAKVVRTGTRKVGGWGHAVPSSAPSSKSFHDDDGGGTSGVRGGERGEVRGVKEYQYAGVFGPKAAQEEVYDVAARPLVEGLFGEKEATTTTAAGGGGGPGEGGGEVVLGGSALLFTLGVTNAGKTHTVMGSGFEEEKCDEREGGDVAPGEGESMTGSSSRFDLPPFRSFEGAQPPHLQPRLARSTPARPPPRSSSSDWGIIPRALDHILARVRAHNEASSSSGRPSLRLYMSYLEVYNEGCYDLLPRKSDAGAAAGPPRHPGLGPPALKLRETRRGRIFVPGLARREVTSVRRGLELAEEAKARRRTASNGLNAKSSRSHAVCQLEVAFAPPSAGGKGGVSEGGGGGTVAAAVVESEYDTDDESVCSRSSAGSRGSRSGRGGGDRPPSAAREASGRKKSSVVWIVDLAGSERSKRTRANARHQKEAALINASLMNLMRCLREMKAHQRPPQPLGRPGSASARPGSATRRPGSASSVKSRTSTAGGGGMIPFRNSRLTHLFMNHLTGPGASRTCMVVNVNPAADDYDETQHVLGYAAEARSVTISAVDYNRKRRMLAREGRAKKKDEEGEERAEEPPRKRALVAKIVKKLSPKKRKGGGGGGGGGEGSGDPRAKRLRSQGLTSASASSSAGVARTLRSRGPPSAHGASGKRPARPGAATKPAPKSAQPARRFRAKDDEVEKLREENFDLKIAVDDLRQQLADCEAEVRNEVVEAMDEQLQESKEWYENRVAQLERQIEALKSSNENRDEGGSNEAELLESIAECEEEMKRMREDHDAEVEALSATHLHMAREHEAATEELVRAHEDRARRLEDEVGTLRHQTQELRAGHDALLEKYNALLASQQRTLKEALDVAAAEKENPAGAEGADRKSPPSYQKLPRGRASDVASEAERAVDISSPKKKGRGGWFVKSPAKVAAEGKEKNSATSPKASGGGFRSPLAKINKM